MKNIRYLLVVFFAVGLILPSFGSAATADELQTQISALLAQIQSLQTQLAQVQGQPAQWCYDFNANLKIEMRGAQIKALHTALEKEGIVINYTAGRLGPAAEASVEDVSTFGEYTRLSCC